MISFQAAKLTFVLWCLAPVALNGAEVNNVIPVWCVNCLRSHFVPVCLVCTVCLVCPVCVVCPVCPVFAVCPVCLVF